jgi:hypothetical protein
LAANFFQTSCINAAGRSYPALQVFVDCVSPNFQFLFLQLTNAAFIFFLFIFASIKKQYSSFSHQAQLKACICRSACTVPLWIPYSADSYVMGCTIQAFAILAQFSQQQVHSLLQTQIESVTPIPENTNNYGVASMHDFYRVQQTQSLVRTF